MKSRKEDFVYQFPEAEDNLRARTAVLAGFIGEFRPAALPAKVAEQTKALIIDTISSAFAGVETKCARITGQVAETLGGQAQASIIGCRKKTAFPLAGMVNAKMANALDLDDCYMNVAHFAPQAVFAALACGEHKKISGKRLLAAVALGYDVAARICLSFNFWRVRRGLISTQGSRQVYAANIFAAAAAAAYALRLNGQETLNAFGLAGHYAPCLTRSIMTIAPYDEMNKYCDAGWSAFSGIMAGLFAAKGYLSTHYALDGRDGYAAVMGIEHYTPGKLTESLGKKWHVLDAAFKTHPCCKYVHLPLQLFSELINEHKLCAGDIDKVQVYVRPSHAVGFGRQTLPEKSNMPFTHNIPYNFAQMIFRRKPNAQWHAEKYLTDKNVLAFMRKVFVRPCADALVTGVEDIRKYGFPREIPARVEIKTRHQTLTRAAQRCKGDPWWPETRFVKNDLWNKLQSGGEGKIAPPAQRRLFDMLWRLEKISDVSIAGKLLRF